MSEPVVERERGALVKCAAVFVMLFIAFLAFALVMAGLVWEMTANWWRKARLKGARHARAFARLGQDR